MKTHKNKMETMEKLSSGTEVEIKNKQEGENMDSYDSNNNKKTLKRSIGKEYTVSIQMKDKHVYKPIDYDGLTSGRDVYFNEKLIGCSVVKVLKNSVRIKFDFELDVSNGDVEFENGYVSPCVSNSGVCEIEIPLSNIVNVEDEYFNEEI